MTILNEFSYVAGHTPGFGGFATVVGILITVVGIVFIICFIYDGLYTTDGFGASLLFAIGVIVLVLSIVFAHPVYETRYEVIIDDTTSFNEIMDKYEIVDQRGQIYTLRDPAEEVYTEPLEDNK